MNQKDIDRVLATNAYDTLKGAAALAEQCSAEFVDKWTAQQWLTIWLGYKLCDYDITPDEWQYGQVEDLLLYGHVPAFDDGCCIDSASAEDKETYQRSGGFVATEPTMNIQGKAIKR